MIRSIAVLVAEARASKASAVELGEQILTEYERAWELLRSGSKVAAALAFEDWEHFWIACYPPCAVSDPSRPAREVG